jgi:hypothetical protein
VLTNIHDPPAEGNFRDKFGNSVKPLVIEDCITMWFMWTKVTRWPPAMLYAEEPGNGQRSSPFTSEIWSHLNTHKSCGGKMTYKTFILQLTTDLFLPSYVQNITASGTVRGRRSPAAELK